MIAGDVEGFHLGLADPDALAVGARVERAIDFQAGLGGGGADQLDHGEASGERPAAPVLRDVAEQPVLDPRLRGDKPCSTSTCPADSGGRGSRARSHRPAFAVRASTAAPARRWSRRSPP